MKVLSVCTGSGACLAAALLFLTVRPLLGAGPVLAFSHGDGGKRHPVTLERTETAGAAELFAQVDAMTVRLRRRAESMHTWAFEPPVPPTPAVPKAKAPAPVPPARENAVPAATPESTRGTEADPKASAGKAGTEAAEPRKKSLLAKIFAQKGRPPKRPVAKPAPKPADGTGSDPSGKAAAPAASAGTGGHAVVSAPEGVKVRFSGERPASLTVKVAPVHRSVRPGAAPVPAAALEEDTFVLWYAGRPYRFNRSGQPIVNRKLLRDDDREVLSRLAVFFGSVRWRLPSEVRPRFDGKMQPLFPREAPVFAGFEDDRYQMHDDIIERCCREFNRDRARWVGANPNAVLNIPPLSPALVKSLMIEESGGGDPKSREAWAADPMQVNVPGDWSEAKAELGLPRPSARNEGTPERNIRAGIKFLARKGFGVSGRSVGNRPKAYFDSWRTALCRYNGRDDMQGDGRTFRSAYADRIRRRAEHPTRSVPIGSN